MPLVESGRVGFGQPALQGTPKPGQLGERDLVERPWTGWATRPRLPDLRAVPVPAADARDGRRSNQPWSVITTPVSA
jgi:hypothetical protein